MARKDRVVELTEKYLTYRKRKKYIKKEIQKSKGIVRDWVGAIIWAVCVVFLINQYIFQLYAIPSPSMENTLLVGDKIFANKLIYGPEILPGGTKLDGHRDPARSDIIIFANPDYEDQGVLYNTAQRLLFMLTLTKVDLDKYEKHYFIKRAAGYEGDTFKMIDGDLYIKPKGLDSYIKESELVWHDLYKSFQIQRGRVDKDTGIRHVYHAKPVDYSGDDRIVTGVSYMDRVNISKQQIALNPASSKARSEWALYNCGKYIPDGYVLPLGDNRDNSSDGRYLGLIHEDEIIGTAAFRIFPLRRMGTLE